MTVLLSTQNNALFVRSPYNERFVKRARQLGGRWDGTGAVEEQEQC